MIKWTRRANARPSCMTICEIGAHQSWIPGRKFEARNNDGVISCCRIQLPLLILKQDLAPQEISGSNVWRSIYLWLVDVACQL